MIVFVLTIVPDPIAVLQILSGFAAIGSFLLAYRNASSGGNGESTHEVAATGGGPTRVMQIMDSRVVLRYPGPEEAPTTEKEEAEERDRSD